jgi:hypothetical protein
VFHQRHTPKRGLEVAKAKKALSNTAGQIFIGVVRLYDAKPIYASCSDFFIVIVGPSRCPIASNP